MNLLKNLFEFDREPTAGEIIFFKAFELFVAYATLKLAWEWGFYTLRISDVVLPLGIARYVDVSFMFDGVLPLVNAGLITACVAAGFFRLWRFSYLIGFLLLHLQYAARFTLGEIPHSTNLVGMTLLGFGLAMMVFRDALHRRRFALGFTYFFLGLGYTLAAFSKFVGTGITWVDGRHLWLWVGEKSVDLFAKTGVWHLNPLQEIVMGSMSMATLFLMIGMVSETFAFLVWWRTPRIVVGLGLAGLHIGIYLIMNIMFGLALIEILLLCLPWPWVLDQILAVTQENPLLSGLHRFSARFG